jgi:hypothetical protein
MLLRWAEGKKFEHTRNQPVSFPISERIVLEGSSVNIEIWPTVFKCSEERIYAGNFCSADEMNRKF